MNAENNFGPERESETQKSQAETGEPVQISLPQNDEIQTGPFPFSGETARQTEEARKEEETQKESE